MRREQPNHVLHFILSLLTGGLWIPVWLLLTIFAGNPHSGREYSGVVNGLKIWLFVILLLLPFSIGLMLYEAKQKRNSRLPSSSEVQTQER